jgi:hypothetical protein
LLEARTGTWSFKRLFSQLLPFAEHCRHVIAPEDHVILAPDGTSDRRGLNGLRR